MQQIVSFKHSISRTSSFLSDCGCDHILFLCASFSSLSLFGHLSFSSLRSFSLVTPVVTSIARILRGTTLKAIFWIAEVFESWPLLMGSAVRLHGLLCCPNLQIGGTKLRMDQGVASPCGGPRPNCLQAWTIPEMLSCTYHHAAL